MTSKNKTKINEKVNNLFIKHCLPDQWNVSLYRNVSRQTEVSYLTEC